MYKTTKFISNDICVFKINPEDLPYERFSTFILEQFEHYKLSKAVFDLSLFEVITLKDINDIEKIVDILKLNRIKSIVCGISPYCAAVLVHFVDEIGFSTTLGIKEAIDVFQNQ